MTARLSTWVALRCKEAPFRDFLHVPDEQAAVTKVRSICGIASRAELDKDPAKAAKFHEFIRRPFSEFMQHQHN